MGAWSVVAVPHPLPRPSRTDNDEAIPVLISAASAASSPRIRWGSSENLATRIAGRQRRRRTADGDLTNGSRLILRSTAVSQATAGQGEGRGGDQSVK